MRGALRGALRAVAPRRRGGTGTEATEAAGPGAGAMERAVVRCVPSEATLSLSFAMADGSRRNLQRDQSEPLGRALGRIAAHALKGQRRAKAKGKGQGKGKKPRGAASAADGGAEPEPDAEPEPEPVAVRLWLRDEPVADDVRNADAWQDGAVLQVGDVKYRVERNPPALTDLRLPRVLLAGFPAWPRLGLEFAEPDACRFRWFREAPERDDEDRGHRDDGRDGDRTRWADTGERGRAYTPRNADVGLRLKLRCTPGDGRRLGPSRELLAGPVEAGPGACSFDQRHLYTRRPAGPARLRAVSYNVLADAYARSDFARAVLFPYCAPYALEPDYRLSLLHRELAGYHADLLCLQEVDRAAFDDLLAPALGALGLDGLFRPKRPQEGLATFYRADKLLLLGRHDVALGDALRDDPRHRDLLERLARNPLARDRVLQRSSVLQVGRSVGRAAPAGSPSPLSLPCTLWWRARRPSRPLQSRTPAGLGRRVALPRGPLAHSFALGPLHGMRRSNPGRPRARRMPSITPDPGQSLRITSE